jgi:hypothetical protein
MKYAVAWVSLGSRETVYEIYDSKHPSMMLRDPSIRYTTQPIVFVSDIPEERKLWKARLILWTQK